MLLLSDASFLAGKSTLLNHLFRTNFREMDAFKGRYAACPLYMPLESFLPLVQPLLVQFN